MWISVQIGFHLVVSLMFCFFLPQSYKPCIEANYTNAGGENLTVGLASRPCKYCDALISSFFVTPHISANLRDLCDGTYAACLAELTLANLLYLVPCNDTDIDGPLYPSNATTYDLGFIDYEVECNNGSNVVPNITCPAPVFTRMGMCDISLNVQGFKFNSFFFSKRLERRFALHMTSTMRYGSLFLSTGMCVLSDVPIHNIRTSYKGGVELTF